MLPSLHARTEKNHLFIGGPAGAHRTLQYGPELKKGTKKSCNIQQTDALSCSQMLRLLAILGRRRKIAHFTHDLSQFGQACRF